jgi:DNA-binding LacI/PurR family transcriptional regulator
LGRQSHVTLVDIASRLGISKAAVSTALTRRDNGIHVSDETRAKVWVAARELGYRMDRLRVRKPSLTRVAVFSAPLDPFHQAVMEICQLLNDRGIESVVRTETDPADIHRIMRSPRGRLRADAAILIGSRNRAQDLPAEGIPSVVIGEAPVGVRAWRVVVDNEAGGRLVGEHLWSLGHRHVGIVMPSTGLAGAKRLAGLRSVWREQGIRAPLAALKCRDGTPTDRRLVQFLRAEKARGGALTALFCWADISALEVLRILWKAGVRTPEQMSVVGFNDSHYAASLAPPLTTVRQDYRQMGALATDLVLERMRDPDSQPKVVTVSPELVVRESTAPPSP